MTSEPKMKGKPEKLKYRDSLDNISRERCDEKLKLIDGKDPYVEVSNKEWSKERDTFPEIVNYLVYGKSAYTFEDLIRKLNFRNYFTSLYFCSSLLV